MVRELPSAKPSPHRLTFHHDPATLRKLCTVAVTAQLWRHEITKYDFHARPLKPGLPMAKSIPEISKPVEKLIDKCIEPVRMSLLLWLKTHFFPIFLPYEKEYDVLRKYFDCIMWQSDCSIDYESTARNLIDCVDVGVICKYKVACTYCFEEDIRRLWNDLPPEYHELSSVLYTANSLVRYWDCRMKVDPSLSGSSSMNIQLFDKLEPENWSAWRYCWSRLPADQRIDKAVAMIDYLSVLKKYVKYLIPLLTKFELVKVLPRCSKSIVNVLATSPENVTYALQTWQFMKHFTTRDSFVKMFIDVLSSDLDVNTQQFASIIQNHDKRKSFKFYDLAHMMNVNVSCLLYEIWQNSPDHLQTHLVDKHAAKILEKLCKMDNLFTLKTLCRDVRLMLELLSRRDTLLNNTFWRKHWTDIVKGVKSIYLDQMIKLCFRNEKEITKFKKSHMTVYSKISIYCGELLSEGYFDELNDFLSFCTSDQSVLKGWKRTMLTTPTYRLKFCIFDSDDTAKMRAFDEFISEIYSEPERRRIFKCHMVTSASNFEFLQSCVNNGFLIPVKNFVNLFLTNEAEIKAVKKEFKQQCHRILSKGEFGSLNVQNWNEFLSWCLDDDQQRLDEFKESLSVNDIYQIMFPNCVRDIASRFMNKKSIVGETINELSKDCKKEEPKDTETRDTNPGLKDAFKGLAWDTNDFVDDYLDGFEKFDQFLIWYFASKSKAEEFKLAKIKKRNVLRKVIDIKNDRLFLVVLHWCFNRDVQKIKEFAKAIDK